MVRHFKPRNIIEIGSGYSSLISGQAAAKNGAPALICVEPFPLDFLKKGFPGLRALVQKKVEDVGLDFFSQLQSGDIFFIDSSHTVKIGGDVNYLFLEVLPRLNPGVIVHVHDILFPFDYRRDWVMDEFRFWTEQDPSPSLSRLQFSNSMSSPRTATWLTITWTTSRLPFRILLGGGVAAFGCDES